jgi:hypothetical protein
MRMHVDAISTAIQDAASGVGGMCLEFVIAIAQSGPVTIRLRWLHRFTHPGPMRES